MDTEGKQSLFQVYLRLRPPHQISSTKAIQDPWLLVEPPAEHHEDAKDAVPTHITLQPPNDSRKRAVERFGFTKVFQENASQLDLFEGAGTVEILESVLKKGRDGLVATLGVTGSGKSHTILGSKTQRGLTQMSLDMIYKSLGSKIRRVDHPELPNNNNLLAALQASDNSEATLSSASSFLESIYGDAERGRASRAQTPMPGGFSRAQTPMTETYGSTRRPPLPRSSMLPQSPCVSHHAVELDSESEYAVVVSMYEVYNDRIFDLLSLSMLPNGPASNTRQGTQLQKDLRRRPLLFKSTELSPDRKVVAGLRKVICGSYEEAMMVLETGLTERRVAGTGSNSVSSRSHGFFCIEVKKNLSPRTWDGGNWTGGTLSIVDLAGSERARSAKTTGSTLAEAGKINESLMYLGQCLQLQSNFHSDKPTVVPYRQCKLTELLFSNSFPTSSSQSSYRTPQKATMIVTADPQGDFNATSQILRYSALAREVTVPRVPSTTSQILSSTTNKSAASDGRSTPYSEELELAVNEIARLSEETDNLTIRLAEEEIKVTEISISLRAAEDKALSIEAEVREECWNEMEARIEEEKLRYRQAWEQEKLKGEEFLDGKIDILERGGIAIAEDSTATSDQRVEQLERENDSLRARIEALEREIQTRSPTKRTTRSSTQLLKAANELNKQFIPISSHHLFRDICQAKATTNATPKSSPTKSPSPFDNDNDENSQLSSIHQAVTKPNSSLDGLPGMTAKTPATVKKQRKLTTRKWDLADESEIF